MEVKQAKTKKAKGMSGHTQEDWPGRTDDWITPEWILQGLAPFDLDPCACREMPWRTAVKMVTSGGLELPWWGMVWCNPPYDRESQWHWLDKLAKHGRGIALIFARTDTEGFHEHVFEKATAILFLKGRIFFHEPSGKRGEHSSGAPSVLVAYGNEAADRLGRLHGKGHLVRLRRER